MEFLQEYEYVSLTPKCDHGNTAQYAILYMDLVRYAFVMNRALRTNNVNLYTCALGLVLPVLWATNRLNNKRWALKECLR